MILGVDISSIPFGRGVSRYTSNLVMALSNQGIDLRLLGYSFRQVQHLTNWATQISQINQNTQFKTHRIPPQLMSWLWKFGQLPVKKSFPDVEVFHSWDWLQPPDNDLPLVSTIHDLSMLKHPETAHPDILKKHQASWEILKARKAHVIAVSRATKKDIVELLGYPQFLVHVIHEALPQEFLTTSDSLTDDQEEHIVQKYGLNTPYILFVGTTEPRKNLANLIEAWIPLSNQLKLIIAGEKGWDNTLSSYQNLVNESKIQLLGRVGDLELAALYANAQAFVYPSLDEGFGLPILEAFHHGTPVITSNVGGTLEVAGDAAELVDPNSPEEINIAINKILSEDVIAQKKRLQRMIIRQHMFNWDSVAEQTIEVYKKALSSDEK